MRLHIGTQKAGSTYLYNLLSRHPGAGLSSKTEVNYFSDHFDEGVAWYHAQFPTRGVVIDCSPTYFKYGEVAARRIAETYGADKEELLMLLILRNPIDYVQSHFTMQHMQGYFKKRPDLYPVAPDTLTVCARMYPQYLKRGQYATLLGEWLLYFRRDQLLIVPFEEFTKSERVVTDRILDFFGLPPQPLNAPSVSQNRALRHPFLAHLRDGVIHRPKLKNMLKNNRLFQFMFRHVLTMDTRERLSPASREELKGYFAEDVERLRMDFAVDTSSWKDFS